MKVKVTDQGVIIPKELLLGVEEVEISQNNDVILVKKIIQDEPDPIFGLGTNPVSCGIADASENHDYYLSDSN